MIFSLSEKKERKGRSMFFPSQRKRKARDIEAQVFLVLRPLAFFPLLHLHGSI
jgi:hypothetical protein